MDYLIGILIGILCGAVPFIFGWFTHHKVLGIIGSIITVVSGPFFVLINKSPFIAIGVAAIVTIFNFAKHRNNNKHHEDEEDEDIH